MLYYMYLKRGGNDFHRVREREGGGGGDMKVIVGACRAFLSTHMMN